MKITVSEFENTLSDGSKTYDIRLFEQETGKEICEFSMVDSIASAKLIDAFKGALEVDTVRR